MTKRESKFRLDLVLYRQVKAMFAGRSSDKDIAREITLYARSTNARRQAEIQDLRRVESLVRNFAPERRDFFYQRLLAGLGLQSSEHLMFRSLRADLDLSAFASFSVAMVMRARRKQLRPESAPEDFLIPKREGHRFAQALNVATPSSDEVIYSWDKVPLKPGTVVKPNNSEGARGVFTIFNSKKIQEIKTGEIHTAGIRALRERLRDMLETGYVREDQWLSQKICWDNKRQKQLARDLKFYCFYGEVPIVLEIDRLPSPQICTWSGEGELVQARPRNIGQTTFVGNGFSQEVMALAQRMSLEIPAPFVRIDFLSGENGVWLCEFTEHPGNFDKMEPELDQLLGDAFLRAEARLHCDLMSGKKFKTFIETFPAAASAVSVS